MVSLLEVQPDMVDSMSPPHAIEYTSAKHALAQDSTTLQLLNKDIEECCMRIARAQAQFHELERQRDAVQRRISIHRARLSSVRTIPDQVLQEIFQHCLPEGPYVVPNAQSAPLVLTHVCRRWRVIVQGTSELWSSIALYDRGVWNYELEVKMVKQWLGRSRMRAIHMSITRTPHSDFCLDQNVPHSDILQLAVAHSSQLRELSLNVNRTYMRHFLEKAKLPTLQSIIMSLSSVNRVDEPLEPYIPAYISAPNLRRIALKGDGSSIDLIPRTIFPQITHLLFDCDMTLDLTLLFRDFPNLQHLTLTLSLAGNTLRFRLPQNDCRTVASSLLCLEIQLDKDMLDFGEPEELEVLLDQLELPALQALSLAAPLKPCYHAETGRTTASWENHAEWVHSPSVASLLSRSQFAGPRFELRDLGLLSQGDQDVGTTVP